MQKENQQQWKKLLGFLEQTVGKKPSDIKGVLFLIGVQELGIGKKHFSKEEKEDLIHIASCKVLSYSGYYTLIGYDSDGWPHWELIKKLPNFNIKEQEMLLKDLILEYFKKELGLHI